MKHTLSNGMIIEGEAERLGQLGTWFQIWAEIAAGLTDEESTACMYDGYPNVSAKHFGSLDRANELAQSGFKKLEGRTIPYFDK